MTHNQAQHSTEILALYRFHVKHTCSDQYKKRVSWTQPQESTSNIAVYEYKGIMPAPRAHSKAKRKSEKVGFYGRLHLKVWAKVKEKVKQKQPKEVYQMDELFEGPRNSKPRT